MDCFLVFIHPLSEVLETVRRTLKRGVNGTSSLNIIDVFDSRIEAPLIPEGPCLLVGDDLKACFACSLKNPGLMRNNVKLLLFSGEHLSTPIKRKILECVHTDFLVGFQKPDLVKAVITNSLEKISSKFKTEPLKTRQPLSIEPPSIMVPEDNTIRETYRFFVAQEKRRIQKPVAAVAPAVVSEQYKKIAPDVLDDKHAIWPFTLYGIDPSNGEVERILEANRPVESLGDELIKAFREGKKSLGVKAGQWNTYIQATKSHRPTRDSPKKSENVEIIKKAA